MNLSCPQTGESIRVNLRSETRLFENINNRLVARDISNYCVQIHQFFSSSMKKGYIFVANIWTSSQLEPLADLVVTLSLVICFSVSNLTLLTQRPNVAAEMAYIACTLYCGSYPVEQRAQLNKVINHE